MKLAILLMAGICLCGQSGLDRPFLGQMIDRQHLLRPVYGMSGSFSVEAAVAEGVIASACSRTLCLTKTDTALFSASGTIPAPPGDAKIGLDSTGATIYFPKGGQFARWQDGSLTMLNLSVDGTVLSLRSAPLNIAVERAGIVWIVAADGSILDSLPADTGAVLLLPSSVVYTESGSLVLRKSDHSELRFPAPNVTTMTVLGDGYVEASAGSVLYALRVVEGREQVFQLPQPPQFPQPQSPQPRKESLR
jgi:hypothetical protein